MHWLSDYCFCSEFPVLSVKSNVYIFIPLFTFIYTGVTDYVSIFYSCVLIPMYICDVKRNKFFKNVKLYNLTVLMFLIRRRYLNLKKLLVVECTVAAVHVQATKHIKEEREQRKKAIRLLWYPKYCYRSKEVGFYFI